MQSSLDESRVISLEYTYDTDGIGQKHKKKRESSTSKASKKTKHKHKYAEILIKHNVTVGLKTSEHVYLGERCSICGKARIKQYFPSEKSGEHTYRMLEPAEVYAKYKGLQVFDESELDIY